MFPRAKAPRVKSDTGGSGGHMHECCPSGEQSDRNASLLTGLYENKPGWESNVKRIQVATEKALQNHNNSRVVS